MNCKSLFYPESRFGGFTDSRAAYYFFDQVTIVVDINVGLVWSAKKIVIVSHYLLVGAHQQECQIIRFARHQRVQLEDVFDVVQVNKLIDDAV